MIMSSKVALLNPNCSVFNFYLISWLVYYPFICALFVINLIKMEVNLFLRDIFVTPQNAAVLCFMFRCIQFMHPSNKSTNLCMAGRLTRH